MTKNSLTRKLILTVVLPVVTVLMLLGIVNYIDTKEIINQLNTAEQNFTIKEISSFIELQFVALDIIEEPIQDKMKDYSERFINEYYNDSVETINLDLVRQELGMHAEAYDLYIINTSGEVVNTTYSPDLGINFFNFGETHKNYLKNIFDQGEFDSPKFFFEDKTKRYKKYSYLATKDKQYIVEIGLYSNQADRVFGYMMDHLQNIAKERQNISNIDLFFWLDNPTSLDPNKVFFESHLNILPRLESELTLTKSLNSDDFTYIYVENKNSKLIKGAIVRLKYDTSFKEAVKRKELLKLAGIFLVVLLLSIATSFLLRPIGNVIKSITQIAKELAVGNLSVIINAKLKLRKDELGDLAKAISTLIAGLKYTADFAKQTGEGNFNKKYKLLSDKDYLGKTLLQMQEHLTKTKLEEEKLANEERKNKFITDGLAHFSETLRSNTDDIEIFSFNIAKNLADYLNVPLVAIYVATNKDGKLFFEAKACIAYDRQKVFDKRINSNSGLVGQCAYEKLPIYLTEIPEDYIEIKSGLGTANPTNLFLVPLINENKIYGVIEMASLDEIEDFKRQFCEQLAKSIASTLSSVQLNQKTADLLEQSRKQQEELAAQETEMRQNMEELQATQEEAMRRENRLNEIISGYDNMIFRIEYELNGTIVDINSKYAEFLKSTKTMLIGQAINAEFNLLHVKNLSPDEIIANFSRGIQQEKIIDITIDNTNYRLKELYFPVENNSKFVKVSFCVG